MTINLADMEEFECMGGTCVLMATPDLTASGYRAELCGISVFSDDPRFAKSEALRLLRIEQAKFHVKMLREIE